MAIAAVNAECGKIRQFLVNTSPIRPPPIPVLPSIYPRKTKRNGGHELGHEYVICIRTLELPRRYMPRDFDNFKLTNLTKTKIRRANVMIKTHWLKQMHIYKYKDIYSQMNFKQVLLEPASKLVANCVVRTHQLLAHRKINPARAER